MDLSPNYSNLRMRSQKVGKYLKFDILSNERNSKKINTVSVVLQEGTVYDTGVQNVGFSHKTELFQ